MAIATTVIAEGTVDVGFPAVLGTGVWALGCRHWIIGTGIWVLTFGHGVVGHVCIRIIRFYIYSHVHI